MADVAFDQDSEPFASWSGRKRDLPNMLRYAADWIAEQQANPNFVFSHIHTWRADDDEWYINVYYLIVTPRISSKPQPGDFTFREFPSRKPISQIDPSEAELP